MKTSNHYFPRSVTRAHYHLASAGEDDDITPERVQPKENAPASCLPGSKSSNSTTFLDLAHLMSNLALLRLLNCWHVTTLPLLVIESAIPGLLRLGILFLTQLGTNVRL
eukprot:GHVU01053849.1.p3 GENE.GHVU01053849.1~~GHVU01053849.1.p3  ORF type:complete len:109 (-),score=3.46 GHVU01053849.1:111-437(-)